MEKKKQKKKQKEEEKKTEEEEEKEVEYQKGNCYDGVMCLPGLQVAVELSVSHHNPRPGWGSWGRRRRRG